MALSRSLASAAMVPLSRPRRMPSAAWPPTLIVGVVAGVALADDGAFGVDEVAVDGDGADVGGGVLDVCGEGLDLGVGGVEAAGFDDALLPLVAVEVESDERADVRDGLGCGEVLLGRGGSGSA